MSETTEVCTQIQAETDKEILIQALSDVLNAKFPEFQISPEDIEWHEEAAFLLGYQGDVRDGSHYNVAKGNIIVRGGGVDVATLANKSRAKATARRCLPQSWNDFAFVIKDGFFSAVVQNFQSDEVLGISRAVESMVDAYKIQRQILAQAAQIGGQLIVKIKGKQISPDQFAQTMLKYIMKQESVEDIEITVPSRPAQRTPARQAKIQEEEGVRRKKDKPRGARRRDINLE